MKAIWTRRGAIGAALGAAVGGLLPGCGGAKLHRVSGRVTFAGQPVPLGKVYFTPDATKGNAGTPGYADIKDGAYDTGSAGGQGCAGGPVTVRIEGSDGTKVLFLNYMTTADLSQEATTKDFDVPQSAAAKLPKDTGPPP